MRQPERITVTGSAGFVGSHLVRRYLECGVSVRAIVRPEGNALDLQGTPPDQLELLELDLCNDQSLVGAFEGQDLVIHAAMARSRAGNEHRRSEHPNVEMTRNVTDACRQDGVPRLLHVSSTSAIGISTDPGEPADEGFRFNLERFRLSYHTSKYDSERIALGANRLGLETVVVNPGVVFGRHQNRYKGGDVIARVLNSSIVVCTGGGLSMVHVDDVVDGIQRVADAGIAGERYILSGDNRSFRAIADTVCRVSGVRRRVVSLPDMVKDTVGLFSRSLAFLRGNEPNMSGSRRYSYPFYSSAKAQADLGYRARAFETIVEDYLKHLPEL